MVEFYVMFLLTHAYHRRVFVEHAITYLQLIRMLYVLCYRIFSKYFRQNYILSAVLVILVGQATIAIDSSTIVRILHV